VNDDVVTLSRINRELKAAEDSFKEQGKSEADAKAEVEKSKGQIIANLISEELLIQKAKELGLDKEIDARLNRRLLQVAESLQLKSLDDLNKAMQSQNVDPEDYKANLRKQITRDAVWESEVDAVIYYGIKDKELKDYYQKNITKFKKPAMITISEIFLSFAGANADAVRTKAKDIAARAKKGEDFKKLAIENSDRPDVAETGGKAGSFDVDKLDPLFAKPLEKLQAGQVSDPIEMDIGMEIIKVDERTKGSNESFFDEDAIRRAILTEKAPEGRRKYMRELLEDSYIEINDTYRPVVSPALNAMNATTEKATK
ncbi:MAG: peptidylprolyl isomerase, partial [Aridibacter sp.]